MVLLIAENFWLEEAGTMIQKLKTSIYLLNYFEK